MLHRRCLASSLEVDHVLNVRLKSGLELLEAELLLGAEPVEASELGTTKLLRRNQDVADDLNDSVCGNAILDADAGEGVNLDVDQATVSSNINRKGVVLQRGGQVDVPVSLGDSVVSFGLDESITVQNVVGHSLKTVSLVRVTFMSLLYLRGRGSKP